MLTIKSFNIDSPVPTVGSDFLLGHIELLAGDNIRLWFTRQPSNGGNTTKYSISGPEPVSIVLAQLVVYQTVAPYLSVDLFFSKSLKAGQYTLSLSDTIETSNGSTSTTLGSTQVVFDLMEEITQEPQIAPSGVIFSFLPKRVKGKEKLEALAEAIEYGDNLVRQQVREAFDEASIATATGNALLVKMSDSGVPYNYKLGFDDNTLRKLAISIHTKKLTNIAISSVLEIMYGDSATHGYLETVGDGPYKIHDNATLDLLVDGKIRSDISLKWADFKNPLQATIEEMVHSLNAKFEEKSSNAFARIAYTLSGKKLRIFSKTKGVGSSIACLGGTFLPFLNLNTSLLSSVTFTLRNTPNWIITSPGNGTVRFQADPANQGDISFSNLIEGDFIVIIGEEFPRELWGTHEIKKIYTHKPGSSVIQWFEIKSSAYDT